MFTLLPNELWDYGPVEAIRGLRTAVWSRHPSQRPTVHLPGLGQCLPVRSARAAIVLALKALALPAGASVAVPLYCCPVVFKAIKAAGCRPRFIDIDPETYCLSPADLAAKSSEVDAVIAVHMFGNLCNMPRLREAAAGKPLIEDCAQALGSSLDGRARRLLWRNRCVQLSPRANTFRWGRRSRVLQPGRSGVGTVGVDLRAARPAASRGMCSRGEYTPAVHAAHAAAMGPDRHPNMGRATTRRLATRLSPRSYSGRPIKPTWP